MNDDAVRKAIEIEQALNLYQSEELESRFEMIGLGNSQCSSQCGTESK